MSVLSPGVALDLTDKSHLDVNDGVIMVVDEPDC